MGNHNYSNLIGMKALKCQTVIVVTPPVARTSFIFVSKVYNNIVSLYEQSHLKVPFAINFVHSQSVSSNHFAKGNLISLLLVNVPLKAGKEAKR